MGFAQHSFLAVSSLKPLDFSFFTLRSSLKLLDFSLFTFHFSLKLPFHLVSATIFTLIRQQVLLAWHGIAPCSFQTNPTQIGSLTSLGSCRKHRGTSTRSRIQDWLTRIPDKQTGVSLSIGWHDCYPCKPEPRWTCPHNIRS